MRLFTDLLLKGRLIKRPAPAARLPAAMPSNLPAELPGFSALPALADAEVVNRVRKDLSDDVRQWREVFYPGLAEAWTTHDPVPVVGFTGGSDAGQHLSHIGFGIDLLNDDRAAVAAAELIEESVTRANEFGRFGNAIQSFGCSVSLGVNRLAHVGFAATPVLLRAARFDVAAEIVRETLTEFERLMHDPLGDRLAGFGHVEHADHERGIGLCLLTDGILLSCLSARWDEPSPDDTPGGKESFSRFRHEVIDAVLEIDVGELGVCALHAITRLVLGLGGSDERTLRWLHTYHAGLVRFKSEDASTYAELAAWMEAELRGEEREEPPAADSGFATEIDADAREVEPAERPVRRKHRRRKAVMA